ncbi:MAG: hypothetical protein DSZ29_01215 [Aquificaceae bacterium]|nr:MAG: hypothetical protein DSZ29_01215 [Aquificaceae bacterium]
MPCLKKIKKMITTTDKYNIAVITRGHSIASWQYAVLKNVLAIEGVSLSTLLLKHTSSKKPPLAVQFLHHIERYLYHCQPHYFTDKAIDDLLGHADVYDLANTSLPDLGEIDFIINFTEALLADDLLIQPKLGVWSIFIGDDEKVKSQLTAVNDFISENDVVTMGLQIETLSGTPNITLYQSNTSVDMASLCRTAEQCLHKTSYFIPHYLNQLKVSELPKPISFAQEKLAKNEVSKRDSACLVWQSIKRITKKMDHKYRAKEQWALIYGENSAENSLVANFNISSFKMLQPPEDRFWADPFVVTQDNKNYIFFEELLFERDLGHLSCMELYADGSYSDPVKILEKPHHLSYPFIFQHDNDFYMIPESGDAQCVELYKCTSFPYQWEFEKKLITNIRAYDSTLFKHDGLWWLFACVADDEQCPSTEDLHLFYADSPLSDDWQAHPLNPIISDAASARPAGKIFSHNGKIYRPSQNCAASYGAGLNLCEITTLSTDHYSEEIISQIFPDWDKRLKGLHTFNFNENITVCDVIIDNRK